MLVASEEPSDAGSGPSGYRGSTLTTLLAGTLHGALNVSISHEPPVQLESGESGSLSFAPPAHNNATIENMRLFVFTTAGFDAATGRGSASTLTVKWDGIPLSPGREYRDQNTSSVPETVETWCYELRDSKNTGASHLVTITNAGDRKKSVTVLGAALVTVYRDPEDPLLSYQVAEGCDAVQADTDEGVTAEDASTTVSFGGIPPGGSIQSATLLVIATAPTDSAGTARITCNDGEWDDGITPGTQPVFVAEIDARPFIKDTENQVRIQSVPVGKTGKYLESRLVILMAVIAPAGQAVAETNPTLSPTTLPPGTGDANASEQVEGTPSPAGTSPSPSLPQGSSKESPPGLFQSILDLILGFFGITGRGTAEQPANVTPEPTPVQLRQPAAAETPPVIGNHIPAPGNLTLKTNPPGAMIYLDGLYTGRITPFTVSNVNGGTHQVRYEERTCDPLVQDIDLDGDLVLEATLKPRNGIRLVANTSPSTWDGGYHCGALYVTSMPDAASIIIDGKDSGFVTPRFISGLKEGQHTVRVEIGELEAAQDTVTAWVYPGTGTATYINLVETPRKRTIAFTSNVSRGVNFTMNGVYPLRKVPASIECTGDHGFITFMRNGVYVSESISDAVNDGDTFFVGSRKYRTYSVKIASEPQGALISIDGYQTGYATPWTLNLSDGPHRIVVAKNGYLPATQAIDLSGDARASSEQTVMLPLEEYAAGYLQVDSDLPGAKIYLAGRDSGEKTPHLFAYMPIGSCDVKIVGEKNTKILEDVVIVPDILTEVYAEVNDAQS
jgi:hypothetical protein